MTEDEISMQELYEKLDNNPDEVREMRLRMRYEAIAKAMGKVILDTGNVENCDSFAKYSRYNHIFLLFQCQEVLYVVSVLRLQKKDSFLTKKKNNEQNINSKTRRVIVCPSPSLTRCLLIAARLAHSSFFFIGVCIIIIVIIILSYYNYIRPSVYHRHRMSEFFFFFFFF